MNLGFSLGYGNTLETMGYKLMDPEPLPDEACGADLTFLRNNLEHRFEFLAGKWLDEETYAVLYRFGINLDQEDRLKIEAQPTLLENRRRNRTINCPSVFRSWRHRI